MKWDRHLDFGVAQQTPQKVQFNRLWLRKGEILRPLWVIPGVGAFLQLKLQGKFPDILVVADPYHQASDDGNCLTSWDNVKIYEDVGPHI